VAPRVRSEEEGDLLKWCERSAGEGIVGEEVGEGRDDGGAQGGAVGAWISSPRVLGGQGEQRLSW
jgi:hypothetical protein